MNLINETQKARISRLVIDNDYKNLSYETQVNFEKPLLVFINSIAEGLEKQINREWIQSGIDFKFIDDLEFNAKSYNSNEKYVGKILYNRGISIQLINFFNKIDCSSIFTKEEDKSIVNTLFVYFANYFIISHEVAHIYYGHCKLYDELKKENKNDFEKNLQVIEWDADCYAITKMCEQAKLILDQKLFPELKTTDSLWIILLAAIHGLYYLQSDYDEYDNIEKKEHPPMAIRESLILKVMDNLIKDKFKENIYDYIKVFDERFNYIFDISIEEQEDFQELYNKYSLYGEEITKKWSMINKRLKKYSYLPIEGIDYFDYSEFNKI